MVHDLQLRSGRVRRPSRSLFRSGIRRLVSHPLFNLNRRSRTGVRGDLLPRYAQWPPRKLVASKPQFPVVWKPHWYVRNLAQAEKDLIGFRQEAEMQSSGSVAQIDPVSALEAELSRVRAELVQLKGVGQETDLPCGPSVKRVCRTGERVPIPPMPTLVPPELSAWLEERHSRIARRIDARRQHSCSGIEHQVVGRSRAHGRDDRVDAQLSVLRPPWRAVGARYGLRGERTGEASKPGPRLLRRNCWSLSGMWSHDWLAMKLSLPALWRRFMRVTQIWVTSVCSTVLMSPLVSTSLDGTSMEPRAHLARSCKR